MKKKIAGLAAATALALLGACSSGGPTDPELASQAAETFQAMDAEQADPVTTEERAFVIIVKGDVPEAAGMPDRELIALGHSYCEFFDRGGDLTGLDELVESSGLTEETAGFIVGSAMVSFCPEHDGILRNGDPGVDTVGEAA